MIAIAATIAAATGAGVWSEHRYGERAQRGSRRLLVGALYSLVPFVAFVNIARLHVNLDVAGGLALAHVMLVACGLLAWLIGRRVLSLPRPSTGALMASAMQANTGYVGVPFVLALLGSRQLGLGVAYDILVNNAMFFLGVFAVGAAFGSRAGEGVAQRLRAFVLRNPPLLAVIAAILAPAGAAPDALVDVSRVAVLAFVPLGFFAVGVALGQESEEGTLAFRSLMSRPVAVAVAIRLLVAPALLLAFAAPLIALPDAYLLQAAMPTGINTLVVAHVYGLDLKIAAGAIAWSTSIVVAAGVVASVLA